MKKEENKKIYVDVLQNNKHVNTWENETNNIIMLLCFIYNVTQKNDDIKMKKSLIDDEFIKIEFTQNYKNYDGTITTTKYVFNNVPCKYNYLNNIKLNDILRGI